MHRGLILVLGVVVVALGVVPPAGAVQTCLRMSSCSGFPPLTPTFGSSVSPRKLPRNEYAPVTADIFGKVATRDGSHPPALRKAIVDIDRDVKVNVRGYPVCHASIEIRAPKDTAVEKACHSALVGRGEAQFEIAFPEQKPIKVPSPLLVFNGGEKGGKVTLLIHTFITVPAPTAIVTRVTIARKGSGLHAVAKVPVIAGGSGSLIDFDFKLGKTYEYKRRKLGYLEARCPDGVFEISFPELLFRNEAHTPGQENEFDLKGGLAVPCTPKG